MTKAIIYKDDQSEAIFCVDGGIYFKSLNSRFYVEAREVLSSLKLIKTKGITERKIQIEKLLTLSYKDAAKYHLENQKSKGRKGKLYAGEYNDK
jgi:hypothetical protein